MLFIDIGIFNKEAKEVSFKSALYWTIGWISLSLIFWGVIYMFGDKIHYPQASHANLSRFALPPEL